LLAASEMRDMVMGYNVKEEAERVLRELEKQE
jgi:hypothetical protein